MIEIRGKKTNLVPLAIVLCLMSATPTFAALAATATLSTSSTSAPYSYTIDLHNTGTTNIGTFWFAWTDIPVDYDFLPSAPTVTGMPSGWIAPITHNGIPGDGYGIEFYNYLGSAIAPGASFAFKFTSPDSPATLAGNAFIPPNKITTSFVYTGFPQGDAGLLFNVAVVPEPAGLALAGIGATLGLLAWRRGRSPRVTLR